MKTPTEHRELLEWVRDMDDMCQPDRIVWITGTETEKRRLEKEAFSTGELIQLNQKKLPGCVYHRTHPSDVARTENLTFICTPTKEQAGPTNNWMPPQEAYQKAAETFRGSMKGRTMYVIPFCMGDIQSPFRKIGVELTDSIYVVLNMRIMTQMGTKVLEALGDSGEFTKCLHGKADLDIKKRLILHFPQDNTVWSVSSGYGGNVLLGKKCMALRIASYLAKNEGWMAEHMLILGIKRPGRETRYIAAAFPSACGKTNLAMLVPPKILPKKGYEIFTVGDDIAWIRKGPDGRLWAVNPEAGFFGVLPGTNSKTNPNAMKTMRKNTIYTNVLLKPDKTVWWEDGDGKAPKRGINWQGKPWTPGMKDENGNPIKGANPNSRFTSPIKQCPSFPKGKSHLIKGVPISAFIFGGRRAGLKPLVFESFSWQHGVYVGAMLASERTAAQYGKQGEVRYDPMAMLPFCGYNMTEYFKHWLKMGKKVGEQKVPKIFCVNWFRKDEKGDFLWPGFRENLRVLDWILERCEGNVQAQKTPIGHVPYSEDIDRRGIELSNEAMEKLFHVDPREWIAELENVKEVHLKRFKGMLPKEIEDEYHALKERLEAVL
ncbi:MAG: phosphoenolpyruvate carboxykinase (GTP) [Candidatus Omnitrophota bacterium]